MIRFSLFALPMLAACGSSVTVSKAEARNTFESLNRVTASLIVQSFESVLDGKGTSLELDTSSGRLSGKLDPAGWTGDIAVDGEVDLSGDQIGYNLALSFDQVEMDASRAKLDGDVAFDFTGDDSIDLSKLKYSAGVGVLGALDLSDGDRGRADLSYDLSLDMNGPAISVDGKGDIAGHDVSSWDQVLSLLF